MYYVGAFLTNHFLLTGMFLQLSPTVHYCNGKMRLRGKFGKSPAKGVKCRGSYSRRGQAILSDYYSL